MMVASALKIHGCLKSVNIIPAGSESRYLDVNTFQTEAFEVTWHFRVCADVISNAS